MELYSSLSSSSDLEKRLSPISGCTSWNVVKASLEGSFERGFNSLKRRKEEEGCFRAEDKKIWSVRRKETRFSGEPEW